MNDQFRRHPKFLGVPPPTPPLYFGMLGRPPNLFQELTFQHPNRFSLQERNTNKHTVPRKFYELRSNGQVSHHGIPHEQFHVNQRSHAPDECWRPRRANFSQSSDPYRIDNVTVSFHEFQSSSNQSYPTDRGHWQDPYRIDNVSVSFHEFQSPNQSYPTDRGHWQGDLSAKKSHKELSIRPDNKTNNHSTSRILAGKRDKTKAPISATVETRNNDSRAIHLRAFGNGNVSDIVNTDSTVESPAFCSDVARPVSVKKERMGGECQCTTGDCVEALFECPRTEVKREKDCPERTLCGSIETSVDKGSIRAKNVPDQPGDGSHYLTNGCKTLSVSNMRPLPEEIGQITDVFVNEETCSNDGSEVFGDFFHRNEDTDVNGDEMETEDVLVNGECAERKNGSDVMSNKYKDEFDSYGVGVANKTGSEGDYVNISHVQFKLDRVLPGVGCEKMPAVLSSSNVGTTTVSAEQYSCYRSTADRYTVCAEQIASLQSDEPMKATLLWKTKGVQFSDIVCDNMPAIALRSEDDRDVARSKQCSSVQGTVDVDSLEQTPGFYAEEAMEESYASEAKFAEAVKRDCFKKIACSESAVEEIDKMTVEEENLQSLIKEDQGVCDEEEPRIKNGLNLSLLIEDDKDRESPVVSPRPGYVKRGNVSMKEEGGAEMGEEELGKKIEETEKDEEEDKEIEIEKVKNTNYRSVNSKNCANHPKTPNEYCSVVISTGSSTDSHPAEEACLSVSKRDSSSHIDPDNAHQRLGSASEINRFDSSNQTLGVVELCPRSPFSDSVITDNGSEYSASVSSDTFDETYVQNLLKKAELLSDQELEKDGEDKAVFDCGLLTSLAGSIKSSFGLKRRRSSDVDEEQGREGNRGYCNYQGNHKRVHKDKERKNNITEGSLTNVTTISSPFLNDLVEGKEDEEDFNLCIDTNFDDLSDEKRLLNRALNLEKATNLVPSLASICQELEKNYDDNPVNGEKGAETLSKMLHGKGSCSVTRRKCGETGHCGESFGKCASNDTMAVEENFKRGLNCRFRWNGDVLEGNKWSCSSSEDCQAETQDLSSISLTLDDCDDQRDDCCNDSDNDFRLVLNMADEDDSKSCTSAECSEDLEKGYSSGSTRIISCHDQGDGSSDLSVDDSLTDSLSITIKGTVDPKTGQTNWTASRRTKKQSGLESDSVERLVVRTSKPRKVQKLLPLKRSLKKKRRMVMPSVNKKTAARDPKLLTELATRPFQEYIKTTELLYHSATTNSNNGRLSIAMNDLGANKDSSDANQGNGLRLGSIDVMYEMAKGTYGESHLKRCRATPRSLFLAAKQGNDLQMLVLAAGCNVNTTVPQENHKTAMHAAAGAGHLPALRILAMVGGNLSSLDSNLRTPLFDAIENHHTAIAKFLIKSKVNLQLKDSNGMTVLHLAAKKCFVDIIDLLMETRNLDIDEQHFLMTNNSPKVKWLLENVYRDEVEDSGGWTPLMWTAEGKHIEAAKCLLKWGASVHVLDKELNTCLHWAAFSGATDIMELLLEAKAPIDGRNKFGATALHISARERKLQNLRLLEKYKPNLEIKDAEKKKAIQLVPFRSKCHVQLERMEKLDKIVKRFAGPERLITSDISRGQEYRPIPCVNEVDDEILPDDFVYVKRSCEGSNISFDRLSMMGCSCSDSGCTKERNCQCAQLSARKRFWYDESGLICKSIFKEDRPLVYECNMKCKCWSTCSQRVVQHGSKVPLQLYKTRNKGWAVRTLAFIPKGTFVCEYVGEILTDSDADKRDDDCYLFDLDVKGHSELFCLDAKFYGNVSRFINHSCDPNLLPVRVFTDHQVKNCPRIAFFASREIKPYEEVCSDYGERFWKVKKSEFACVCKSPKCKYKAAVASKK